MEYLKKTIEMYIQYYRKIHNMNITILRYTNVYGNRQNFKNGAGVLSIFLNNIINGNPIVVNGDGTQTRDYVHIDDVVEANKICLDLHLNDTYNICTSIGTSLIEIINMLRQNYPKPLDVIYEEFKDGDLIDNYCSYDKFYKTTGWKPKVNLEFGLKTLIRNII